MSISKIEICNMALTYSGMERIQDIDQATEEARKLKAIYEPSLKSLLEAHPWNFATKRSTLALLEETPDNTYSYYFALPTDFIRIIRLSDRDIEYRIEGDKLATNDGEIEIEYIAYISDEAKFSASFVEAFAMKLAFELSISLTDKEGIWDRFEKLFKEKFQKATFNDSQQGTPAPLVRNNWIEDRFR